MFMAIQTILRLRTQAVGVVAAFVGLLLVLSSVPPQDGEGVVILGIGTVVAVLGLFIIRNPEKVSFGGQQRGDDDEPEHAGREERRDQRLD